MAWSWSHTSEAYDNAHRNLYTKSRDELEIIFAEWKGSGEDAHLDEEAYDQALGYADDLPLDLLISYIWEQMQQQATCDNGGYDAWACPYGCGPHKVSFS